MNENSNKLYLYGFFCLFTQEQELVCTDTSSTNISEFKGIYLYDLGQIIFFEPPTMMSKLLITVYIIIIIITPF